MHIRSYYIIHISEEKQELEDEFKSVDVDASGIAERFVCSSVCLFIYLSSIFLTPYLSICLSVYLSLCLSFCMVRHTRDSKNGIYV